MQNGLLQIQNAIVVNPLRCL